MTSATTRWTVVAAVILAVAIESPSPAIARASVVQRVRIASISFLPRGAVEVAMTYVCPAGHESGHRTDSFIYVDQFPHIHLWQQKSFGGQVVCDGASHLLTRWFGEPAEANRFRGRLPIHVSATLEVASTDSSGVQYVRASHRASRVRGTPADVRIVGGHVTRSGGIRLFARYTCPPGSSVDRTYALVSQSSRAFRTRHFGASVDCDGTTNVLSVEFDETARGEPFEAHVENLLEVSFVVSVDDGYLTADDTERATIS